MNKMILSLAAVLVAATGLAPAPSAQAVEQATARAATVSARQLVAQIPVRAEKPAGYDRDYFDDWQSQGNGCDTRDVVLIRQSRPPAVVGGDCDIARGRWLSRYDGVTVTDPGDLDVDHMVPLAEAWGSGARAWPQAARDRYANDLGYRLSLLAVTASSNRSKGDSDPAEWLPVPGYRCAYVASWVAVKWRWRLSWDSGERAAVLRQMNTCPRASLIVPKPARAI